MISWKSGFSLLLAMLMCSDLCAPVLAPVAAQEPSVSQTRVRPIHEYLTPQSFPKMHAMIKPQSGEALWAEIPWHVDLHEARVEAARAGKPLFVWSASADPLGCT